MPHGGYHGTIMMGGNVIQQGDGQGGIQGGIDDRSRLDKNPPQSNNQNINQQVEDKKKEIELLNIFQEGMTGGVTPNIDQQVDVIDQGFFPKGIMAGSTTLPAGMAPGSIFPITGATGVDAKGLATLQNFQNQQLNNLLEQQQQINLANQIKDSFATYQADEKGKTADNLRKLFTGDLGDKTFLGINFGSTETTDPDKTSGLGAATVINPYTGERITTGKIREGMTSPEYAQYMSELYDLNPALMEQIFPFASGQVAKPIFAKALEAAQAVGSGIAGLPGVSELGQMGGDIVGAMISPLSGLFTGKTAKTPKIKYDNQGNVIDIISQAPDGGGTEEGFKPSDRKLPYIHSGEIPAEYLDGFTKFYQNYEGPIVGGAAITPVTLPDGSVIEFGDTGSARVFREYLESIGATQPEKPSGIDAIIPQKKIQPFDINAFYASLPQYTQQGIMNPNLMSYYQNLGMFPGMAV